MDTLDAWSGSPTLCSGPFAEPSLEVGTPHGWNPGLTSEGLLGEIDIAATPAAVRLARSYVRAVAGECFGAAAPVLDDLELLTSEAVTNSVVHARPRRHGTVTLSALHADGGVRVEVIDGGPRPRPLPAHGAALPEAPGGAEDGDPAVNGRGLLLIHTLAADHGRHSNIDGSTTFWFKVAVDAAGETP